MMIRFTVSFLVGFTLVYGSLFMLQEKPLEPITVSAGLLPIPALKHAKMKRESALTCLSKTLYFEAGNQGEAGMTAVANVVMNRLQDDNFPSTVCDVVEQAVVVNAHRVCQFTWYCEKHTVRYDEAWRQSRHIAQQALKGSIEHVVGNAKFYHADYVTPAWAAYKTQVGVIGSHIFYE